MLPRSFLNKSDAHSSKDVSPHSKTTSRHWTFHIPNILTICRIILAGIFPIASEPARPWIVIIGLITEFLDGALSRWLHAQTLLGQLLDPIADKLFFGSVAVTLLVEHGLSLFELLLLGIRDLAVVCSIGYSIFRGNWHIIKFMRPRFFGKLATALQYGAFMDLIFFGHLSSVILAVTGLVGVCAAVQYYLQFVEITRHE